MAEPYRIVVGLEVHVQLLTRTKLFCGCLTKFGQPPNSATCPVCLGMPGTLPVMNRQAFELALRAALALNCHINNFTKWDRKNYYYPDLPKNYQISQYDLPFSENGWLEIETSAGSKKIGIIRAHLEEDAGKMMHDESGGRKDSLVDLNRAGTPLVEIVSKPDISTPEEAKAYLDELRLLLKETGVSDCEMQEGSLRCDANVNIHIPQADGTIAATPLVEVKNLNSFRGVERAIKYEAGRQYAQFQVDGVRFGKTKTTAGWDDARGETVVQRRKEEASDYRYFPEPDLVPVTVDEALLTKVRTATGELPSVQRVRLEQQYGLKPYDAKVLTAQGRAVAAYFEDAAGRVGDGKAAANWVINKVLATLNKRNETISNFGLSAERLAELVTAQKAMNLTKVMAEEVFETMLNDGLTAQEALDKLGVKPPAGEGELGEIIRKAIAGNAKAVADYKKGKKAAAQAIFGAVMRETKGTAKADVVQKLLEEELGKV